MHAEESLNSGTLIVVQCVRSYPPIANLLLSFLFKRARSLLGTISLAERTWCLSLNERVSLESAPAVLEGASWQNCDEVAKLHSKRGGPGKAQGMVSS